MYYGVSEKKIAPTFSALLFFFNCEDCKYFFILGLPDEQCVAIKRACHQYTDVDNRLIVLLLLFVYH